MDNSDNNDKPTLSTTDKVRALLKQLDLDLKLPVEVPTPQVEMKSKLSMPIEEYKRQNQASIDALNRVRSNPMLELGLWPDLWPEHTPFLDEDVRSKVDFFQIPRSIRFFNALDMEVKIQRKKPNPNDDIN